MVQKLGLGNGFGFFKKKTVVLMDIEKEEKKRGKKIGNKKFEKV